MKAFKTIDGVSKVRGVDTSALDAKNPVTNVEVSDAGRTLVMVNLANDGGNVAQGEENKANSGIIGTGSADNTQRDNREIKRDGQKGRAPAEDLLNTRKVEDLLYKRLIGLGLSMVDPNSARQRLNDQADKAQMLFNFFHEKRVSSFLVRNLPPGSVLSERGLRLAS